MPRSRSPLPFLVALAVCACSKPAESAEPPNDKLPVGAACTVGADCASGVCTAGVCAAPKVGVVSM